MGGIIFELIRKSFKEYDDFPTSVKVILFIDCAAPINFAMNRGALLSVTYLLARLYSMYTVSLGHGNKYFMSRFVIICMCQIVAALFIVVAKVIM